MRPLDRARARVVLTVAAAGALGLAFVLIWLLAADRKPWWLVLAAVAFALCGLNVWVLRRT